MNLNALGIACKSINDSIEFYKLFDLNFKKFGKDHYEAETKNGLRVMLDSYELLLEINPNWKEPVNSGVIIGFSKEKPSDVDKIYHSIKDSGFKVIKEPWDAFWGQRYASVQDPNGNQVDIFATLSEAS